MKNTDIIFYNDVNNSKYILYYLNNLLLIIYHTANTDIVLQKSHVFYEINFDPNIRNNEYFN